MRNELNVRYHKNDSIIFSGKDSLDELLFMYMMARSVKFDRIGTFLAYGIKNILQYGKEENIVAMQSHLDGLMRLKDIDLLKLSQILGLNSYSNLDLLEPYELDMSELNLNSLKNCYNHIKSGSQTQKKVFVDRQKPMKTKFLQPSPCSNMTANPNCKAYCEWHKYAEDNFSTQIRVLLGYVMIFIKSSLLL